jgi:hypothetical protein
MQTSAEPEETWKDLKKLGYDEKLDKKSTQSTPSSEEKK